MTLKIVAAVAACLTLGACAGIGPEPVVPAPVAQVPSAEEQIREQIATRAAPNQNIASARLHADDNCYWFSYAGPVETTELPLMTREGRHLCGPAQSTPSPDVAAIAS